MPATKNIAPHEAYLLHDLIATKNVCATKTASMAGLVKDDELKAILQQDVAKTQSQIRELQNLLMSSSLAFGIGSNIQ